MRSFKVNFPLVKCHFGSILTWSVRSRKLVSIHSKSSFVRQKLVKKVISDLKNVLFYEEMLDIPSKLCLISPPEVTQIKESDPNMCFNPF